jgi:hypothetical protein
MRLDRIVAAVLGGLSLLGCATRSSSENEGSVPTGGFDGSLGGSAGRGSGGTGAGGAGGSAFAAGGSKASGGSPSSNSCAEVERCCPRYLNELDRNRCDGIVLVGDETGCAVFLTLSQATCGSAGAGGTAGTGGSGGGTGGAGGPGGSAGAPTVDCGSAVHEGNVVVNSAAALSALAGITKITGYLEIGKGFPGPEVSGLESLRCVQSVSIYQSALANTRGFDSLLSATAIIIRDNPVLTHVEGFSGIARGTSVSILENPELTEIAGFSALTTGGEVSARNNPRLTRIVGFSAVREVFAGLSLVDNDALVDITGFAKLEQPRGITILGNASLETLTGLEAVQRSGAQLTISNNDSLANLAALARLESVTAYLEIESNALLPDCEVQAFVSRLTVGGEVSVGGNLADNCTP